MISRLTVSDCHQRAYLAYKASSAVQPYIDTLYCSAWINDAEMPLSGGHLAHK